MDRNGMLREILASSFGGLCGTVVGYPFDTVKVRMQTHPEPINTIACARFILSKEGVRGFFRGASAVFLAAGPINAIYFMGYYCGKLIFWNENTVKNNDVNRKIAAAAFSGFVVGPVYAVLDRFKCMLQVQRVKNIFPGRQFKGPIDLSSYLISNYGITSCCKGLLVTLCRDVPGSIFYFGAYDWIRSKLNRKGVAIGVPGTMIAGGTAGALYWASIMPIDTVKTMVQITPHGKGAIQIFFELMRERGFYGFFSLYRGMTPVIARAFPSSAVCFLGYEIVKFVSLEFGL